MARLLMPPQTGPADTSGTKDAGETPLEPSSRSKKNGTRGGPSHSTSGAGSTNIITLPESNRSENVRGENTQRRRIRQRGKENSGEYLSENSAGHQACGSLSGENNVSRNRCSPSKTNECNSRTLNRNKKSSCQSSSKRVRRSSASSSSVPGDTTEYVSRESGGESSSDDEGDEIDLRAKTAEELGRHGEHFEDSEDTESSEVGECAVQASFGLFDPHERDEEAICCLLRQSVLRSNLRLSPSALQQVAAAVANQGNVGSVLKTIDDEAAEDGEELQQKAQECGSGSTSSSAVESPNSSKQGASPSSATAIAACGRQAGSPHDSVRRDTHETKERQEEGESGTVVGFLTLLSFQQYPEVVATFEKAVRELASEHASAEQKRTLEQIFTKSVPDSEDRIVNNRGSSTSANKAGTARNNPAAQLRELGDGVMNCGWLLKERLSNTPPQLLPQMYDSLLEDISWSLTTKEMDEAERPFYAYSHVCGLTKVYKAGDGRPHSGTFKRHRTREVLPFDAVFPHPEDELLIRFSSLTFTWATGQSVRISLENDEVDPSSATVPAGCEQTWPATRIRCCPEYLVFFAMPFEQFRRCKDAIAARAREAAGSGMKRTQ